MAEFTLPKNSRGRDWQPEEDKRLRTRRLA